MDGNHAGSYRRPAAVSSIGNAAKVGQWREGHDRVNSRSRVVVSNQEALERGNSLAGRPGREAGGAGVTRLGNSLVDKVGLDLVVVDAVPIEQGPEFSVLVGDGSGRFLHCLSRKVSLLLKFPDPMLELLDVLLPPRPRPPLVVSDAGEVRLLLRLGRMLTQPLLFTVRVTKTRARLHEPQA